MNKKEKWVEAQKHEREYVEQGKNKVWRTPHSLDFWKNYLMVDNFDGLGLEIGCGPNGVFRFAKNIIGLDPIESTDLPNFIKGVGEDIPLGDNSKEFVIICNALDHCMDPDKVIEESFRVAKKLYLGTHIHPKWVSKFMLWLDPTHPYRFTEKDIYKLFEKHNVKIVKKGKFNFLDLNLKYVRNPIAAFKLITAHILGVRVLCLHVELV